MSDIDGPVSASTDDPPLVGNVGQEFVQGMLAKNPKEAIEAIQLKASFRNSRCQPLLELLDQLGLERRESHQYVVNMAMTALLEKIPHLSADKMVGLLEETFPFIGIPELRAVPLAVLDKLYPIPVNFVKQLAMDNEVFWALPARVQRQIWGLDKKLLQMHALSLINAYKYEMATWMQTLNMDVGVEETPHPQLSRKMLRKGSASLSSLTSMVGSDPRLYKCITDIFTMRFDDRDSSIYVGMKESALCACKTQLLMSLQEKGEAAVCATDRMLPLVWALESCIRDKMITKSKLAEIDAFLNQAERAEEHRIARLEMSKSIKGPKAIHGLHVEDDAESAGIPGPAAQTSINRELGEASMCLRDPPAFHLIVHEIIRSIEASVAQGELPRKNERLWKLTKVLSVGADSKFMFREDSFQYLDPDQQLIETLYPYLAGFVLDAKLMEMNEHDLLIRQSEAMAEAHKEVVFIMIRSEVARKVIQIFSLEKLASKDLWMAESLLELVVRCTYTLYIRYDTYPFIYIHVLQASCIDKVAIPAIPEFAPFAYTLARRISNMISNNIIEVQDGIWNLAVEKILLNLVDSETEAHEEILRLLMVAAPKLDGQVLGSYLDTCLQQSSNSRQKHSERALEEESLPPRHLMGEPSSHHFNHDQDDDYRLGNGDGVHGTYMHIVSKYPELNNASIAPVLHAYLSK